MGKSDLFTFLDVTPNTLVGAPKRMANRKIPLVIEAIPDASSDRKKAIKSKVSNIFPVISCDAVLDSHDPDGGSHKDVVNKPVAKKKISAASEAALGGNYTRNALDWLQREDDYILESVMKDASESINPDDSDKKKKRPKAKSVFINDFAVKFSRDPVLVIQRIVGSQIPEMFGIDMEHGSEEEAEFMGLALAGIPVALALRWCAATEDQVDRPDWSEIEATMTEPDHRKAMHMVREEGLWFTEVSQIWSLDMLVDMDAADVRKAVIEVIERIDAPTPDVVSQQLFGAFEDEKAINWACMPKATGNSNVSDLFAMPNDTGGIARSRRGRSSMVSTGARAGTAEYSANPGNWGGAKKQAYFRKRRTSGARTSRSAK